MQLSDEGRRGGGRRREDRDGAANNADGALGPIPNCLVSWKRGRSCTSEERKKDGSFFYFGDRSVPSSCMVGDSTRVGER